MTSHSSRFTALLLTSVLGTSAYAAIQPISNAAAIVSTPQLTISGQTSFNS